MIQLDELMRGADIAARATRLPFTFFFAASLFYLGITIVSMLVQRRAEAWATLAVFHGPRCLARYRRDGTPIETTESQAA